MSLPEASGGAIRVFFENFIEVCGVIKATFKSDIKDIHIGGFDKQERFLYALDTDIIPHRHSHALLEYGGEIATAVGNLVGKLVKRDAFLVMCVNIARCNKQLTVALLFFLGKVRNFISARYKNENGRNIVVGKGLVIAFAVLKFLFNREKHILDFSYAFGRQSIVYFVA